MPQKNNEKRLISFSLVILLGAYFIVGVDEQFLPFSTHRIKLFSIILGALSVLPYLKTMNLNANNSLKPIFWLFVLFIIPTITSVDIVESFNRYIFTLLILSLLYIYVIVLGIQRVNRLLFSFCATTAVLIAVSSNYLILNDISSSFYQGNFKGIFYNSNYLGLLLGIFIIPIVYLKYKNRPAFILLLLNLVFILWETRSRAAILSLLLIIAVYFYYHLKESKNMKKILIIFILVFIPIVFGKVISRIQYYFVNKYEYSNSILDTRSQLWEARIIGINAKPFLGWGFGINPLLYSRDINEKIKNANKTDANTEKGNSFLALLEESGIPLGLIQMSLIGAIILKIIKLFKHNESLRILYLVSVASFLHVNFESWLFYLGNFVSILFWLIILTFLFEYDLVFSKKANLAT